MAVVAVSVWTREADPVDETDGVTDPDVLAVANNVEVGVIVVVAEGELDSVGWGVTDEVSEKV